jgi:hypothetical protein
MQIRGGFGYVGMTEVGGQDAQPRRRIALVVITLRQASGGQAVSEIMQPGPMSRRTPEPELIGKLPECLFESRQLQPAESLIDEERRSSALIVTAPVPFSAVVRKGLDRGYLQGDQTGLEVL